MFVLIVFVLVIVVICFIYPKNLESTSVGVARVNVGVILGCVQR